MVKDSFERLREFYSDYETLFFSAMFCLYSCAYVLIVPFMSLYASKMTDAQYIRPDLATLMVVSGILTNLRNPGGQLINAAGHFKQTQFRSIAESAVNIASSLVFTLLLGINGVVIGSLCSSFYRGIDVVVYSNRHILSRKSIGSFIKIIIIAAMFFGMSFIFKRIHFDFSSWSRWIFNASVVAFVFFIPVAAACVYLRKKMRKENV